MYVLILEMYYYGIGSYLELGHDDLVPVWQRPLDGQLQGLAARELGVGGAVLV